MLYIGLDKFQAQFIVLWLAIILPALSRISSRHWSEILVEYWKQLENQWMDLSLIVRGTLKTSITACSVFWHRFFLIKLTSIFTCFMIYEYCLCKANHLLLSNGGLTEWNWRKNRTAIELLLTESNDTKISSTFCLVFS